MISIRFPEKQRTTSRQGNESSGLAPVMGRFLKKRISTFYAG
ncbi:hypothetical protein FM107_15855 [Sphingobacterium sp. JB170]|nr:hypothetical protein FM107_15855 [Sphingobacterium sp. JB170]